MRRFLARMVVRWLLPEMKAQLSADAAQTEELLSEWDRAVNAPVDLPAADPAGVRRFQRSETSK